MTKVTNRCRKTLRYFSFIFPLIMFGCQEKSEVRYAINASAEVIPISLFDAPEWDFNNFFEFEKVITLDNRSIISGVNKIIFQNEKIFILDQKSKSILRFSNEGIHEKRIHFVGKGPEEYFEISDFIIDNKSKDIIILDGNVGQQMVWYDWDGSFKKKQSIPFNSNSFNDLETGFVIYCGNYLSEENKIDDKFFNNIVFCDSNFHVGNKQVPISSEWNGLRYLFKKNTAFSRYGKSIYCQIPMPNNNTIYKIINGVLHPQYRFDFGYELDRLLSEGKSTKEILTKIKNAEIPHNLNSYFENDQIIYFAILKGDKIHQVIYTKDKKKVFNRSVSLENLDRRFFPTEYHGDGTFLVHVLFPFLIAGNELENYIPEEIRIKAKSEDNPILVFFKIKQQLDS